MLDSIDIFKSVSNIDTFKRFYASYRAETVHFLVSETM